MEKIKEKNSNRLATRYLDIYGLGVSHRAQRNMIYTRNILY